MTIESLSKYQCLAELSRRLADPALPLGGRIPGEAALAEQLGVGRHLVRLTLAELTEQGYLERRGRSGTYLVRRPGPASLRGMPPPVPEAVSGRMVSLSMVSHEVDPELLAVQDAAMARRVFLHANFAIEQGFAPTAERQYLLHLVELGVRGVILHPTPLKPGNDGLYRQLAGTLRLAHVGFHGVELPEQSFFLPDYRYGGLMAAAWLGARACDRLALLSSLPVGHHVLQLIHDGMTDLAGLSGVGAPVHHGDMITCKPAVQTRVFEALLQAGPRQGVLVYSDSLQLALEAWLAAAEPDRARWPVLLGLGERLQARRPWPRMPALCYDWRQRVLDALDWVLEDDPRVVHRLYAPVLRAAEGEEEVREAVSALRA